MALQAVVNRRFVCEGTEYMLLKDRPITQPVPETVKNKLIALGLAVEIKVDKKRRV